MTVKFFNLVLIFIFVSILSGCVHLPDSWGDRLDTPKLIKLDTPKYKHGLLYIYRVPRAAAMNAVPHILINDEKMPLLWSGGYQIYNLKPGNYVINTLHDPWGRWTFKTFPVEMNISDGEISYIRIEPDLTIGEAMTFLAKPPVQQFGSFAISSANEGDVSKAVGGSLFFAHVKKELGEKEIIGLKISQNSADLK